MEKILSSEEYDQTLSIMNMDVLEEKSTKTMEILNTYEKTLNYNKVSELLPAFARNYKDSDGKYLIVIKYPTYEIAVIGKQDGTIPKQEEIKKLLQEENKLIIDYPRREDVYHLFENKTETINVPFVKCMDDNLKSNIELKNRIEKKLKNAGYSITLYPSTRYVAVEIEYTDEKFEEFMIVHKKNSFLKGIGYKATMS